MPNPYPARFTNLLDREPPGAVCIDLGSGGRQHAGLISMEYLEHPNNSLRGDCLALPFRNNSVDLILSQATIEHVTRPELAFDEMLRVLKPYGILYVEIAFMQPVHMAPYHYFNITPHGLTWLLRDWDVSEQGTLGTFDMVLEWLHKEVGSKFFRRTRWAPNDGLYSKVAYGVYAVARKPV